MKRGRRDGAAQAGWSAVASFKTAPVRLVVTRFDQNAAVQGQNT